MIIHAAEIWLALFAAFAVGSLLGWLVYRWIDRSDYAFDQRELGAALGRRLGRREEAAPRPAELPVARPTALLAKPEPAAPAPASLTATRESSPREEQPARPTEREARPARPSRRELRRARRARARKQAPAETNAAETLRERVRASTLAESWRASRQRRAEEDEAPSEGVIIPPPRTEPEAEIVAPRRPEPDYDSGPRYPIPEPPKRLRAAPRPAPRKPEPEEEWTPTAGAWPPVGDTEWPVLSRPALPQLTDGRSARSRDSLVPLLAPAVDGDQIWSNEEVARQADPEIVEVATMLSEAPKPLDERPPLLSEPPADPDDLRKIKGIGQAFEKKLNRLGIYRYRQIADWTVAQQKWVGEFFGIAGRIERDDWSGQAARLAAERVKGRDQSEG